MGIGKALLGKALTDFKREVQRGVNKMAYDACRRASVQIVNDLKSQGPYYEGLFEKAWEVQRGNVTIPADRQPGNRDRSPLSSYAPRAPVTPITLDDVPNQRVTYKSVPSLTIGNRMVYRDIALDLVPGRLKEGGGGGTAPQDWYLTYYGGGGMDRAVARANKGKLQLPGETRR